MKKLLSITLVIILVVIVTTFSAGATNATDVGKVGNPKSLIDGVDSSNINMVRKLIIEEYQRGIKTASLKDKGKSYFDYGESTKEYVHAWVGSMQKDQQGNPFYSACMFQDFTGGSSISGATLANGENWCCIIVTLDSLKKGEAYTVRDGIANAWGNSYGCSSDWGFPTGNQRWLYGTYVDGGWGCCIEEKEGWYCYQTFTYGYAESFEGDPRYTRFYRYDEGNVPPDGGEYDFPPRSIPSDDVTSPSYYIPSSDAPFPYGKLYDDTDVSDFTSKGSTSSGFLTVKEDPNQSSQDILLAETQNSSGEGNDSDSGDSMGTLLSSKKDVVGRTDLSKGGWIKILLITVGVAVILGGITAIIVIRALKKKQRRITETNNTD